MANQKDSLLNDIFPGLKEVCDQVAINPSKKNLEKYCTVLKATDPNVLDELNTYVLFPICVHLTERSSDEKACMLVSHLLEALEIITVSSIDTFMQLYYALIFQIQDVFEVSTSSEELKILVLQCLSELIKCSSHDVLKAFFTRKYYSKLSAGVFLCTTIAKVEKFLTLKVEALKCLMLFTQVNSKSLSNADYKAQIIDILILMVPGLMTACLEIINHGEIQNHKVIVAALRLWSKVLTLVAEDGPLEDSQNDNTLYRDSKENSIKIDTLSQRKNFATKLMSIKRDKQWLENTNEQMLIVTKLIVKIHNHQHWKVRLELALSAFMVLQHCGNNLPSSVGYLVEVLAILSQDDEFSVADKSKYYISQLRKKCESANSKSFVEIVEENFFSLLTRLPRILNGKDETLKEDSLMLFCGYMDILGQKHVPAILGSVQHYNRFLHCLLVATTPDCSSVSLMEELSIRDLNNSSFSNEFKWRWLKNCVTEKSVSTILRLCAKVIMLCDKEVLISSLLDEFNSNSGQQKAITLLLINLVSAVPSEDFYPYSNLLKDVVCALMDPSLWNAPIYFNDEGITKQTIQENIVQICLLADAVGLLAVAAGPEHFSPLLLKCLYPVLECAGSPLSIISSAGRYSVHKLSSVYNQNVSSLIAKNVDYLSHHVTLKLRQAHRNPRVLSVLSVVMDYTTLDMLPSLHDIINDVLVQSCDRFQSSNANAFLHVFETYLSCVLRWSNKENNDRLARGIAKESNKISWIEELIQYNENLTDANHITEEKVSPQDIGQLLQKEEEILNRNIEEPEKLPLPDHIKMTVDVLNRSLHFLPANDLSRQILCLQILNKGVFILSNWKNELLPVVHKMWSPLVERFRTSNHPLLLQRAFSLLVTLAKHSKDFIRSRTLKDVLPSLNHVLKENSKESNNKSATGAYTLSQTYKLQLLLLSSLGQVALDLDLAPKDVQSLLVSSTPYLSSKQPPLLQEACINMFKELSDVYSDVIWVHLMTICPYVLEMKSDVKGFPVYKFECGTNERKEYMGSVKQLLNIV